MTQQPQTALVTGATRRIGRAIALRLASEGYRLALHCSARALEQTKTLALLIAAQGGEAMVLPADLQVASEVADLLPLVRAQCGAVHLLVNNASVFEADGAGDFETAVFDQHMAVNLRAPCHLAQALAAQPDLHRGAIINIIDQRVWRLNPGFFTYTLSKSALWAATQTMAQAFAPRIRVNAIGPGPTLANKRQSEEEFMKEAQATLLQLPVDLEAIADAAHYLALAKSVTGQMIAVDGGQHLAWQTPDVVG